MDENIFINGKETYLHDDTSVNLKMFMGRNLGSQTYLIWVVSNLNSEGSFIICRSKDGENYEIIGVKPSGTVPQKNYTGYYFIDKHPCAGAGHYKVIHIDKNNSCFKSHDIIIEMASGNINTEPASDNRREKRILKSNK